MSKHKELSLEPGIRGWEKTEFTQKLLSAEGVVSTAAAKKSVDRIRALRDRLKRDYVGFEAGDSHIVHWLLAAIVARENSLLVGAPGAAKTELATRVFKLLDLHVSEMNKDRRGLLDELAGQNLETAQSPMAWWDKLTQFEEARPKFFHYQLSRFTQPEEIFGPTEISLLRQGIQVRVNFGMLTGPGVRGAFLDEVFKASSSILNTLLTVINERTYSNWGTQIESDLLVIIGASNEMPGGFATGTAGHGTFGEDFDTLHAFLDRFAIRLHVPLASATNTERPSKDSTGTTVTSHQEEATNLALAREARRFTTGDLFEARPAGMPVINDFLCLGRYLMQHLAGQEGALEPNSYKKFQRVFYRVAADLREEPTSTQHRRVTWTISPRKLRALYKIALAHAVVRSGRVPVVLTAEDLDVFSLIWDTQLERTNLEDRVRTLIKTHWN